jgi:hypothetical protein
MGDRRDAADHPAGFDRAQPRGAFPEERRDDSGKAQLGLDAQGTFDPLAARLQDVAHPAHPSKYLVPRSGWPLLAAASAVRPVAKSSLQEPRPVSLRSDA